MPESRGASSTFFLTRVCDITITCGSLLPWCWLAKYKTLPHSLCLFSRCLWLCCLHLSLGISRCHKALTVMGLFCILAEWVITLRNLNTCTKVKVYCYCSLQTNWWKTVLQYGSPGRILRIYCMVSVSFSVQELWRCLRVSHDREEWETCFSLPDIRQGRCLQHWFTCKPWLCPASSMSIQLPCM